MFYTDNPWLTIGLILFVFAWAGVWNYRSGKRWDAEWKRAQLDKRIPEVKFIPRSGYPGYWTWRVVDGNGTVVITPEDKDQQYFLGPLAESQAMDVAKEAISRQEDWHRRVNR